MTYKNTLILAVGVFALGASVLQAADADGRFAVRGIGSDSCNAVTTAIEAADAAGRAEIVTGLSTWLGGYLTFANRVIEGRFDATPLVSDIDMLAVVVDRCEREPDLSFEAAAFEILSALSPYGSKSLSEVVIQEDSVTIRQSTLVALRDALSRSGYLEQRRDDALFEAVERFNADQGIDAGAQIAIETVLRAIALE
jgi:hypothetical protein